MQLPVGVFYASPTMLLNLQNLVKKVHISMVTITKISNKLNYFCDNIKMSVITFKTLFEL